VACGPGGKRRRSLPQAGELSEVEVSLMVRLDARALRASVGWIVVERVAPNALKGADRGPTSSAWGTTRATSQYAHAFG